MDILCHGCGHRINAHHCNDLRRGDGCNYLDSDGVCECTLTPQDIASAREQALVAALESVEYVYFPHKDGVTTRRCPSCGSPEGTDHRYDKDCLVRAALAAAGEAVKP